MRLPVRLLSAIVAATLVTGCSSSQRADPPAPTASSEPGGSSGSGSPTSPTQSAPPAQRPPIRIALAGDVHFEGALAGRLQDPSTALAPAAPALADADLAIVNLETSVGTGGRPEPGKRFLFSAPARALDALTAAGVDVASMANNHALDYGRGRLPSTWRAVRSAGAGDPPLDVVGIGRTAAEAFEASLRTVDQTTVATVAASLADQDPTADRTGHWAAGRDRAGVADALDPTALLAAVRRADRRADVVVAYLHWGVQGQRCPSPDQRSLATRLVAAGADIVAGSHTHRLQGDGRLGRGYVAYGLGNFAWYSPGPTGVLTLTVRPAPDPAGQPRVTRSRWWPAQIGTDGLAAPLRGGAKAAFRAERAALRTCAALSR